jgi:hypothetical protein
MFWAELVECPEHYLCVAEVNGCVKSTPPECQGINECSYEGQKICKTDTKYRECNYNDEGCLVWDCST